MLCKEIIQVIEASYPKEAALDFDNVGLLAGRLEKEVSKVYLALDATEEVIDKAIALGTDMLITHHPLIFSPMKRVTDEDFIGRRVVKLLKKRTEQNREKEIQQLLPDHALGDLVHGHPSADPFDAHAEIHSFFSKQADYSTTARGSR